METDKRLVPILFATVVLLLLGELYLLYSVHTLQMRATLGGTPPVQSSNGPGVPSSITVGSQPVAYQGTIAQLGGNHMQIKISDGSVSFTLSPGTTYVEQGAQKSNTEYSQELAAYNAKVRELMQDPQGNAAALKALILPLPNNQVTISLTDFHVGNYVFVTPGQKNADGSYEAITVGFLGTTTPQ